MRRQQQTQKVKQQLFFSNNPLYPVLSQKKRKKWKIAESSCDVTDMKISNHDIASDWLNECKVACYHGVTTVC